MGTSKTLGGDRLGSGNRMKVYLHGYERSTHDLSYIWRSTMAAGTLVPFMSEVALPGDTFDIDLECDIKTHPTTGPLFGSYKVQLDTFLCPIRLYQGMLHNNKLGVGLDMAQVQLPVIGLKGKQHSSVPPDIDNSQINPSCIMSYLGVRGVGMRWANPGTLTPERKFNAVPLIAYWDIYKNYYANKQEEIGAVIHTPAVALVQTVTTIELFQPPSTTTTIPISPGLVNVLIGQGAMIKIKYTVGGAKPLPDQILFTTLEHGTVSASELAATGYTDNATAGELTAPFRFTYWGNTTVRTWKYQDGTGTNDGKPAVVTFDLNNLDRMREELLKWQTPGAPFSINASINFPPYLWIYETPNSVPNLLSSQEGLGLKTYQSDLFNNWLSTEWIEGSTGINAITAIDTSSGSFTLDTLNLSKKVYEMLNRIAVSGGSYNDWIEAAYGHESYRLCESPMYMGGLIRELVFQEVVSTAESGTQDLGTLGGKGVMATRKKGGRITIKVDEPSYIMGIISLTPRVDYSQGNKWDVHLKSLDDFHKPGLDGIGFQDLLTDQMAWWDSNWNQTSGTWNRWSAGKQPAWINYMTNYNRTYGNFAVAANASATNSTTAGGDEMYMTLNRRYELDTTTNRIKDLTTYIDPSKFNFIFAQGSLDAQNFWAQIGVDITARRKMSAKVMPNV